MPLMSKQNVTYILWAVSSSWHKTIKYTTRKTLKKKKPKKSVEIENCYCYCSVLYISHSSLPFWPITLCHCLCFALFPRYLVLVRGSWVLSLIFIYFSGCVCSFTLGHFWVFEEFHVKSKVKAVVVVWGKGFVFVCGFFGSCMYIVLKL